MSDGYDYQVLSVEDRSRLRIERVRALEAEICRIELAMEDALSDEERASYLADGEVIRRRLEPHYLKMGLVDQPERGGTEDDHAPAPPGELPTAG